jgi:aminotransferase
MTRLAFEHNAVNLAQGFPNFPAPEEVKEAAVNAVRADNNQYEITWGAPEFRRAVAERFCRDTGLEIDPEREMTVCCGATETMIASLLAIIDPGDEVVVFEPFYENYGPDAIICGAATRHVRLHPPDWTIDPAELAAAFTDRTRAVILNTPNNPTGKVFTADELELVAEQCRRTNAYAITDEIYQFLVYDGFRHISLATLPGMRERTITINAMSKTYSVTGWRVGYAIAPPEVTNAIRKMHDFLTVGSRRAFAASRCDRLAPSGDVLPEALRGLSRAARPHVGGAGRGRVPLLPAARRLLHHGGHLGFRLSQ